MFLYVLYIKSLQILNLLFPLFKDEKLFSEKNLNSNIKIIF